MNRIPFSKRVKLSAPTVGERSDTGTINSHDTDPDDIEEQEHRLVHKQRIEQRKRNTVVYLETIDRKVLDFDSEKVCSVSLSDSNIYGCLRCNRYFRGRSRGSECFAHSINEEHHVFISFNTFKFYILPENYELDSETSKSLKDIRFLANPTFTKKQIDLLDKVSPTASDLNKQKYNPGFIGMVNFGANDYANAVFQSLAHISIVRNYFLQDPDRFKGTDLVRRVSLLLRKLWSPYLFKPHISAHEVIQYISNVTNKKFSIQKECHPKDFLLWLLNHMHSECVSELADKVISKTFRGKLKLNSKKVNFWLISLSLPSATLFKDGVESEVPQVKLESLIKQKSFQFLKMPNALIISINRIDSTNKLAGVNNSGINPAIVKFNPDRLVVNGENYKLSSNICMEIDSEDNIVSTTNDKWFDKSKNIEEKLHYKVQLLDKAHDKWFEMKDLKVRFIDKELLFLSSSCLQIWEKVT